jgi:Ser/Thr protein kinase RdoA (MazF antagonist)
MLPGLRRARTNSAARYASCTLRSPTFRASSGGSARCATGSTGSLPELRPSPGLSPQGRDLLRSHLQGLTPTVFESPLPAQAIHGDASIGNLLRTGNGLIWNDLEDACVGPVHWDVAGLIIDARTFGGSEAFVADFLRAYGGVDIEELNDFIAAHVLYTTVWKAFDAQRRAQTPNSADVSVSH